MLLYSLFELMLSETFDVPLFWEHNFVLHKAFFLLPLLLLGLSVATIKIDHRKHKIIQKNSLTVKNLASQYYFQVERLSVCWDVCAFQFSNFTETTVRYFIWMHLNMSFKMQISHPYVVTAASQNHSPFKESVLLTLLLQQEHQNFTQYAKCWIKSWNLIPLFLFQQQHNSHY